MSDLSAERIAENDATFRAANEKVAASADAYDLTGPVPFICECAEETCTNVILVSLDDYREIRKHPRRFLNVPGHEALMLKAHAGIVVEDRGTYLLVEKIGVAGEIVEQLADADDPSRVA
jgi:hypothetical protein